jgi:hypothetical protein
MFKNIDRLIRVHNERYPDMNLFYSNPNMYVDAIHKENIEWPVKYDDLFPYADNKHDFWTGYFTSRSNLKGMVKDASNDFTT